MSLSVAIIFALFALLIIAGILDYRRILRKPTRVELEEREEDWQFPPKHSQTARYVGPKGRERL